MFFNAENQPNNMVMLSNTVLVPNKHNKLQFSTLHSALKRQLLNSADFGWNALNTYTDIEIDT